jgi:glycosyltransferase involved in cell wall biosynthesis
VLAVGRLVPEKGFEDLIAAHEASDLDIPLIIAGAADHGDAFSRSLLAKASDRVRFVGFQKRDALGALYHNASLFVLPSYHEGLPIAALEAIAAGSAVLLSDIDANKDLGLSDVCYFPVGDRAMLAQKLKAAHSTYKAPREQILADYDWLRIAERTRALYAAVVEDAR